MFFSALLFGGRLLHRGCVRSGAGESASHHRLYADAARGTCIATLSERPSPETVSQTNRNRVAWTTARRPVIL